MFLYQLFLWLYPLAVRLAALSGNPKAKRWVEGRRNWRAELRRKAAALPATGRRVWLHAASLGEFEQGRPVIEALKQEEPDCQVILTFFSPSGYEIRKDYPLADLVCYLPMDGKKAAEDFIELLKPDAALFVKYEFWYWYLKTLHGRHIPTALVSATFRENQAFFSWYGGLFRKMLRWYDVLFVQDEKSAALLQNAGISTKLKIAGDTRYDRVAHIAAAAKSYPLLEKFRGAAPLLIAGSTWPADEELLSKSLGALPPHWKLVIAPHEIDGAHLNAIDALFGGDVALYSSLHVGAAHFDRRVLVIDNIGMLSSLYRYGEIAYIGGGFAKSGIHNVLEPAVFGLPVLFGPVYRKFVEAVILDSKGLAFPVADVTGCIARLKELAGNDALRQTLRQELATFVKSQTGATAMVMDWLLHRPGGPKRDGEAPSKS